MKNLEKILEHTVKLSMLEIKENEKKEYYSQMDKILGFVDKLNELNTDNIEPTLHILKNENVTRNDTILPSLKREEFLNLSPKHNNESIEVPQIIKDNA